MNGTTTHNHTRTHTTHTLGGKVCVWGLGGREGERFPVGPGYFFVGGGEEVETRSIRECGIVREGGEEQL